VPWVSSTSNVDKCGIIERDEVCDVIVERWSYYRTWPNTRHRSSSSLSCGRGWWRVTLTAGARSAAAPKSACQSRKERNPNVRRRSCKGCAEAIDSRRAGRFRHRKTSGVDVGGTSPRTRSPQPPQWTGSAPVSPSRPTCSRVTTADGRSSGAKRHQAQRNPRTNNRTPRCHSSTGQARVTCRKA